MLLFYHDQPRGHVSCDSRGCASTHSAFICSTSSAVAVGDFQCPAFSRGWSTHCFSNQGEIHTLKHKRLSCPASVPASDRNAAEGTDLKTPWLYAGFCQTLLHITHTQRISRWHHGSASVFCHNTPPPHTLWSGVTLSCFFLLPCFIRILTYFIILTRLRKHRRIWQQCGSSCFHDIISACLSVWSAGCRLYFTTGARPGDQVKTLTMRSRSTSRQTELLLSCVFIVFI